MSWQQLPVLPWARLWKVYFIGILSSNDAGILMYPLYSRKLKFRHFKDLPKSHISANIIAWIGMKSANGSLAAMLSYRALISTYHFGSIHFNSEGKNQEKSLLDRCEFKITFIPQSWVKQIGSNIKKRLIKTNDPHNFIFMVEVIPQSTCF